MSYSAVGDMAYASTYNPMGPSTGIGNPYWANPWPVAFPVEPHVPVPGWGFSPNLAGPARLGVGADPSTTMQRRYIIAPLVVGGIAYMATKKWPIAALGGLAALLVASKLESAGA